MNTPKYPELFPIALGNEEETMLMTGPDRDSLEDPIAFMSEFSNYLPSAVTHAETGGAFFLSNGGMIYDGGTREINYPVNLERTTPECATPRETATYIQANEKLLVAMLGNYVTDTLLYGLPQVARVQRRVIDSQGNGRGCHDNFELKRPGWVTLFDDPGRKSFPDALSTYLATRSFMTGAGYVDDYSPHFAQKVSYITTINEYGFNNSAFRVFNETSDFDDTGPRVEIRCNDINISPWAIQARVGGMALFLTALQTPLLDKISTMLPTGTDTSQHLHDFHAYNYVNMSDDWQMRPGRHTLKALDFHERVLELSDEKLGRFVPLDDEYRDLITEMRYYCEDFRKVLAGELDFTVLADRSDMAAKFAIMKKSAEKAARYGISRDLGHIVFQAIDMRYDSIFVSADRRGRPKSEYGYGYQLRDRGAFRLGLKDRDVQRALYNPPETTRAKIRASLIKTDAVDDCSWNHVSLCFQTTDGNETSLVVPLTKVLMSKDEINATIQNHASTDKITK